MKVKRRLIKVDVTATDIRKGVPESICNCPIARAITRKMRASYSEVVHATDLGVINKREDDSRAYMARQKGTVNRFIIKFDNGDPVKPFSFTMTEATS